LAPKGRELFRTLVVRVHRGLMRYRGKELLEFTTR